MLSHIVVSVLLCTASCEPAEIRVWDGDSIRLGTTRQSEAVRIFNIDAPEIGGNARMNPASRCNRRSGWPSF